MKHIITMLLVLCAVTSSAFGQNYVREGKTFSQVSVKATANNATKTGFTWKDSKGNSYDIYITKNGRCYVERISSKTGNTYKSYLPENVAREICKELNIKYVENEKRN